jgi:hypothetical protein
MVEISASRHGSHHHHHASRSATAPRSADDRADRLASPPTRR